MSLNNFIPTVWSETLRHELAGKYIGVANCNREFEGEIKNIGSQVKICGIAPVTTFQYTKDTDMPAPETLSDSSCTLSISRATAFNIAIDDIDIAQAAPNLMQNAMRNAAEALADDADKYVFTLYRELDRSRYIAPPFINENSILDIVIKAREMLYDGNVTNASDIVLEVSPPIASYILKSKLINGSSDNATTLSNGYIGNFCGCSVYVSKNVEINEECGYYECYVRTRRAIAFADQLSQIHAYRPENRFADAIKGLHLYGATIVYPKEIVVLEVYPET